MKKFILIGLIIAVTAIGACFALLNGKDATNGVPGIPAENGPDILFEDSYINFAWGFQYAGTVICHDGSIYSFDLSKKRAMYDNSNIKEKNSFLLQNAALKEIRVSDKDMAKMIGYAAGVDASKNSERKNTANDAGAHKVMIYDYANNKTIDLMETGDFTSNNTSPHVKDLIRLIEKYTHKVRSENVKKQRQEESQSAAKWKKDALAAYKSGMPVYADLSGLGLGVWKRYKDERGVPCILRAVKGKIETLPVRADKLESIIYPYDGDRGLIDITVYPVNNLLFVELEVRGPTNMTVINKDDIKDGKYDLYMFNIEEAVGDGKTSVGRVGEYIHPVKQKLQPFPKQQMTINEFNEKLKNNEFK